MDRLAFENSEGETFRVTKEIIDQGLDASRKSPRKRIILPIHRRQDARVQRMINFLQPGTYIRPHLHPRKEASETIIVAKGKIRLFLFTDNGKVRQIVDLFSEPGEDLFDIEPGIWHSFIVLEADTVLYECKAGPYDGELDKRFANWAPDEFTPETLQYLNQLQDIKLTDTQT